MSKYLTKNKAIFILLIFLLVASGTIGTFFAFFLSALIDCASGGGEELLSTLMWSILFVIACVLSDAGYRILKVHVITDARKRLKNDLFENIYLRNMTEYESGSSAEYINELSNNINIFENTYFKNFMTMGELIVSLLVACAICIYSQPVMLLVMFVLAFLTLGITKLTAKPLEQSMAEYSGTLEEYTAEIKDDFTGFATIHLFHTIDVLIHKHRDKNSKVEAAKRKSEGCQIFVSSVGQFVGMISTVIVMAAAAYFSQKGMFSAGMTIVFGHLIGNIVYPITAIPSVIANFHASRPLKKNFEKILVGKKEETNSREPLPDGDIVLEHLTFGYGEKLVLNDCSFRFESGKHYLLLGNSGEGKSSLLNLLAGLYRNYTGNIRVGDIDLVKAGRENMAASVAMVKQDTFLFNDTIRNNITLFREGYTQGDLEDVSARTGLKQLVTSLPDGLETLIYENGSNFSGGEKQRIGLARALLRNSRILLLDEFTANLDPGIAKELEDGILGMEGKTVITVTHQRDREKLEKYDHVLMLRNGKIEPANVKEV